MLSNKPYDLCIMGAGMAGSMLAAVAARRGMRVVVIEAGPRFDFSLRLDQLRRHKVLGEPLWPWKNTGRDTYSDSSKDELGYSYTLNRSRVKAVGGSTLHWGGMAQRLQISDFETASRYGLGQDWPIRYDDLEPYYGWAEREIGVSGEPLRSDPPRSTPYPMPGFPMSYEDAAWVPVAEKLGIDVDPVSHARNKELYKGRSPCIAYSVCNLCPSGARYSAHFHMEEAERSGNCLLLTETVARRIELTGNRVTSLHATRLDGSEIEIRAKHFAVTAHAVESARLMLLSGLGNQSGQLGRNLMEHWYVAAGGFGKERNFPGRIGFTTLESHSFYDGAERHDRGAIKIEFGSGSRDPLVTHSNDGVWGTPLATMDCNEFGHWIDVGAEIEHQPNPNSRVTLDPEKKDMFGDPAPHIHFSLSDIDHRTHRRAVEIVTTLLEARGLRDIKQTIAYGWAHHHMGTCRMSADPAMGVVDSDCRVHGIDNLYVVGSSVFPTGGARQPTLTIAALALRLADQLTGKKKDAGR